MPIKFAVNNRVLNNNARAVDPAKLTLDRILPIQARRYHEAFRVNGYRACLYHPLKGGVPCACRNKANTVQSLLDEKGRADIGTINSLLTGEHFGVLPYGVKPSDMRQGNQFEEPDYVTRSPFEASNMRHPHDEDTHSRFGYQEDTGIADQIHGTPEVKIANDANDPRARTIVPKDMVAGEEFDFENEFDSFEWENPNALAELQAMDDPAAKVEVPDQVDGRLTTTLFQSGDGLELAGMSDISCPICFGTGWVGGFSLHNGYRTVKSVADKLEYDDAAFVELTKYETPGVDNCSEVEFSCILPPAVQVDALRAFSDKKVIPAIIRVDEIQVAKDPAFLEFCDGKEHLITVSFNNPIFFTHFEIQLNQSEEWALFELPRIARSGSQLVLDDTDPFTINVSPMIPYVGPKSIIVESTYGKPLLVRSVPSWNDRKRRILGWDCEVRVVQPNELWSLLPKRLHLEAPTSISQVRDNSFGYLRT
jgi:hypothetical protein